MNFNWKHKAGALALSLAMLSVAATGPVEAKGKSGRIESSPNSVVTDPCKKPGTQCDPRQGGSATERNKSGRIEPTVAPPSTERGIKDPGVRSCGSCGATGREAAPPPVDDGAAPPSGDIVHGPNGGMIIDKGKPNLPTAAKTGRPKERDPTPTNDKKSSLLPVLGGVAALAALAAAVGSGGDDNPTSP